MPNETTITASEAARRLGVELNYLYNLVLTGRLEARKQNGAWVVSARAVEERRQRTAERSKSV